LGTKGDNLNHEEHREGLDPEGEVRNNFCDQFYSKYIGWWSNIFWFGLRKQLHWWSRAILENNVW
jgi:hypothetical protein